MGVSRPNREALEAAGIDILPAAQWDTERYTFARAVNMAYMSFSYFLLMNGFYMEKYFYEKTFFLRAIPYITRD